MKTINLKQIKIERELSSLYEIDNEILKRIRSDMKENGFKESHPLVIWKRDNDYILVDGHTRLQAAKDLEIKNVPVEIVTFLSMRDAVKHSHKEQNHRRNLSNADLVKRFMYYREIGVKGPGREADKIAKILSISSGQARKIIYILNNATSKELKKILLGDITINSLFNVLHEKKMPKGKPSGREDVQEKNDIKNVSSLPKEKPILKKDAPVKLEEKINLDSFLRKIKNRLEKISDDEELDYFDILTGKSKKHVVSIKWNNGEEGKLNLWGRTKADVLKQFRKSSLDVKIESSPKTV